MADEQTLKAANLGTDGPALLEFFRSHTLTDADREQVRRLIGQLGDDDFDVREKASADLVKLGPKVMGLLRPAVKDRDAEVARRAEDCLRRLERVEKNPAAGLAQASAAVRLLAVRKPGGAVEVLLGYLPFANHELVIEQVEAALVVLAVRDGKSDPVLVKALTAADPLRRATAGMVLARAGAAGQNAAIRKLLQDPDSGVRLRVGLALAAARDKEAVPVLIDLLGELSPEQSLPIENVLHWIAGEKAPAVSPGTYAASRKKYRDAWAAWWRANGAAVQMPALDRPQPLLGYTLVVIPDGATVYELDRDRKTRWRIDKLESPFAAEVLPGGRVLIAEYSGRVTERNLKGEILWEKKVPGAMQCQRLANGSTLIVTPDKVFEIDTAGKERVIYERDRSGTSLLAARKLPNGRVVVVDALSKCVRLDAAGKELSRFTVGETISNNCLDVLPNGHVIITSIFAGKVTEYDAQGKSVWAISFPSAMSAHRLPNGNTLLACHEPARVVEVDLDGKIVWEHKTETSNHRPWFATRR
jgi:hypothetical protein